MTRPARFDSVIPFWFWNGRMQPDDVLSQVRQMKSGGIRAFFVHPRFGMTIPYLGETYFRLLRLVVDECRRLDMRAWLYDEYPFPSGVGGGELISNPANWMQALEVVEQGPPHSAATTDGAGFMRNGINYYPQYGFCDAFIYGYEPNYFNPGLFPAFQETVLDRYAEELGGALGDVVPGIFTDEPKINSISHTRPSSKTIPWWDGIEADYSEYTGGESLRDDLWVFSSRGPEVSPTRTRFWDFVAETYIRRWFQPYRSWCDAHGLLLTGHLFLEEGLYANTIYQADFPKVIRQFAMPGVDYLTRQTDGNYGLDGYPRSITKLTGPKLTQGIIASRGETDMLSETLGCAGWNMNSSDMKRITDWLVQLGVTVVCPHAFFYTIRGPIKNDAPPSHFTQNPVWIGYRSYARYLEDLMAVLRCGRYPVDEIVLYPREHFTARFIPGEPQPELAAFHLRFERLCRGLFERGCNFTIAPTSDAETLPRARIWIDESSKDDYADLLHGTSHQVIFYADANLGDLLETTTPPGPLVKKPGQEVTMTRWIDGKSQQPLWFVVNSTSSVQRIQITQPCQCQDLFRGRSRNESPGSVDLDPFESIIVRPATVPQRVIDSTAVHLMRMQLADVSMKTSRAVQRVPEWTVRAENNGRRRRLYFSAQFSARRDCRAYWAREDVRAGSERAQVWINDCSLPLGNGLRLLGDPEIDFFDISALVRDGLNNVRVEMNEDPWVSRESGSISDSWVLHEGVDPVGDPVQSVVTAPMPMHLGVGERFLLQLRDGGSMIYRIPALDICIPIGPLGVILHRDEVSRIGGHLQLVAYHAIRRLFEDEPDREVLDHIESITISELK